MTTARRHFMRRRFLQRAGLGAVGFAFGARCSPVQAGLDAGLPYTAAEIAQRLGISMAVHSKERLAARLTDSDVTPC